IAEGGRTGVGAKAQETALQHNKRPNGEVSGQLNLWPKQSVRQTQRRALGSARHTSDRGVVKALLEVVPRFGFEGDIRMYIESDASANAVHVEIVRVFQARPIKVGPNLSVVLRKQSWNPQQ